MAAAKSGAANGGSSPAARASTRSSSNSTTAASSKLKQGKNTSNAKKRITPKKPKARVLRLLKAKEPKIIEGGKQALLLKGTKCPGVLQDVLRDLVRAHAH